MASTSQGTILSRFGWLTILGLALLVFGQLALDRFTPTALSAPPEKPVLDEAGHAQREAALAKSLGGPVDIFMDITQIEGGKPSVADLRFVDLVDVTGKELLRFTDSKKQHWLIDPDAILAFRVRSK